MTGRGSRSDGPDQHLSHHEVGEVSRSNTPPSEGAVVVQEPSFPICAKHVLAECEKGTRDRLRLLRFEAYSRGNDWHLSADFAQEVVLRVAEQDGKTMCDVTTRYCTTRLTWVISEYWRRKYDLEEEDPTDGDDKQVYEAVGPPWLKSLRTATKEAVHSLPRRQRQVITARFLEDKTVNEVCQELELPANVVHNYTSLGLARLEPLLEGVI